MLIIPPDRRVLIFSYCPLELFCIRQFWISHSLRAQVWAIDHIREEYLTNELITERIIELGPSGPTVSPTFAPVSVSSPTPAVSVSAAAVGDADSPSQAPTGAPAWSPGMAVPQDYVSAMAWVVPVGLKHIRTLYADHRTDPKVLRQTSVLL